MSCPLRGWCSTIMFHYPDKEDFIKEVCETETHRDCTVFMGSDLEDIVPKECVCGDCPSQCLRHPGFEVNQRVAGQYKDCKCSECEIGALCFPVVVVRGEEKDYVQSLSEKDFERLMNTFYFHLELDDVFVEPLQALIDAIKLRKEIV